MVNMSFFSFPLNLMLFLIWAVSMGMVWKYGRKSFFVRFMLSPAATISSIALLLITCLVIGLTGYRWITGTWAFALLLLYFQTVLVFVILRGWRRHPDAEGQAGKVRWRFVLLHAGILLAVASAFWGAPDTQELRLQAYRDVPVREAYHMDGRTEWLDYEIRLDGFSVTEGPDGVPSDYEARLTVGEEAVVLKVNHPFNIRFGEDLYLSGYDTASRGYCILQIVREPWRYGALAGIIMMLSGAVLLFIGGPERKPSDKDVQDVVG